MKKRWISMLLVLSVLLNCGITAVQAEGETTGSADTLAEWEAQLGEFTMTPANAYTPSEAENLLSAEKKAHAYTLPEEQVSAGGEYVPGEVLFARSNGGILSSLMGEGGSVDSELAALGVVNAEPVYTVKQDSGILFSAFGLGDTSTTWYRAEVTGSVPETVEALKNVKGISEAEPNYIYTVDSIGEPEETERQESWFLNSDSDKKGLSASSGWKQAIKMNGKAPGEGAVVAVIDTGVDYTHPDLASNMWVNAAEFGGVAGVDDDGNGYIDDIYGINTTAHPVYDGALAGNPMDDNGHGTHVAGIIAMANNKTGGVGIAYGAKIMAIKAGQSTGSFSASDIAEAIEYASSMGADVINMSFGGTGRSNLIEAALEAAFSTCVLVAAAGNDGLPTTDAPDEFMRKEDIYPAGYRYVLGVMASDENGGLASFSNWDYKANLNCEYELAAPGTNVFSTLPGNRYAKWNGTSMAAPCVSAAAAILRGCYADKDEYNSRFIMGQLASATETYVTYVDAIGKGHTYPKLDLYQSLTCLPKPNLSVAEVFALDNTETNEKNDSDRIMDAGETVDLGISIRNQWGKTGEITVKADALSVGGVVNPFVTFVTDTVTLQAAGAYSSVDNGFVYDDSYLWTVDNPIRFTLDPDTPNDAEICINLTVTTTNGWDKDDKSTYETETTFTFRVQKGQAIRGHISADTTLTADTYWIVENALVIDEGATLTVEPGTQIQFWSSDYEDAYGGKSMVYLRNNGTLNMVGTEEAPIEVFPGAGFGDYVVDLCGTGTETLEYCRIVNARLGFISLDTWGRIDYCGHCEIWQTSPSLLTRFLENGSIRENDYCPIVLGFDVEVLEHTILHDLSGRYTDDRRSITIARENENLYDHSSIDNRFGIDTDALSMVENTVFLGRPNDADWCASRLYPSTGIPTAVPEFVQPFTYEGADSKYVIVHPYVYEFERALMEDLAAELGGTLLILNDAEEDQAVRQLLWQYTEATQRPAAGGNDVVFGNFYLGYTYNGETEDWVWDDGTDYVPQAHNYLSYPLAEPYARYSIYSRPDSFSTYLYNSNCTYESGWFYVLEFPAACSDDEIEELLTGFDYDGCKKSHFTPNVSNSAILNPVLDTDTERWLQFVAQAYTAEYYYPLYGNYWGTENENLINKMIRDDDDFSGSLADIRETPILTLEDTEQLEKIYPFVTRIWLTEQDSDKVVEDAAPGVTYDVHVTYNRDMEPTVQPTVTYGGEAPFTDYRVYGEWVSDREWVGTTKISGVATGGKQIFRAVGGCAADDSWLVCGTDELRFQFNIAAASAQSVVLNAAGDVGEVELTWAQNEYEVLGGYNLYRATEPTGYFTKVNDTILSDCFYTDTDVEAGVTYYYYYTIVDTDGNEIADARSNVASATPADNVRPVITHTAVNRANAGSAVTVAAAVTDNIAVGSVTLWYRTVGAESYSSVPMNYMSATGKYTASIPKAAVTAAGVEYYIEAFDNFGNRQTSGSIAVPYRITTDATPTLLSAFPSVLDVGSSQTVTVYGTHLAPGMTVKLGTVEIETYTVSEDGSSISFTAPALPIGTYTLTVATDGKTVRLVNAVTYREIGSYIQINSGSVLSGEILRLPVYVGVTGALTSFYAEVTVPAEYFSDASVELAEGVNGTVASYCNGETLTFTAASGSDLNPGSQKPLAYLVLTPNAVQAETTTHLTLTSGRLNGAETISGEETTAVTIYPNFSVNVQVLYFRDQKPVSDVSIQAAGVTGTTDASGVAALSGINRADVTVFASKDGYTPIDVEAFDAVLALQATIGMKTLNEYQMIAGDVNLDGRVNEVDAALILQKCVFLIDSFPAGSWAFVPASQNVTLTSAETTVEFIAILIGDIDGSWKGNAE